MAALNTTERDRLAADIPEVELAPGQYLARRWACIARDCSGFRYDTDLVPGLTPRCTSETWTGHGGHAKTNVCNSVMANEGVYVLRNEDMKGE